MNNKRLSKLIIYDTFMFRAYGTYDRSIHDWDRKNLSYLIDFEEGTRLPRGENNKYSHLCNLKRHIIEAFDHYVKKNKSSNNVKKIIQLKRILSKANSSDEILAVLKETLSLEEDLKMIEKPMS